MKFPTVMSILLAATTAFTTVNAAGAEQGEPKKNVLQIAQQGNFYVGGQEVPTPDGSVIAGAMFVEFQIPANLEHPYPIIFIHGGASNGASYWSTPDLREGWATQFLRKGYSVYVVDLPTSGRSPHYEPTQGPQSPPSDVDSLQQRITRPADFLAWPQARFATQFPGTGKPGDPAYWQMKARAQSSVETPSQDGQAGLDIRIQQDLLAQNAVGALLEKIGPSIIFTHSRSGATGWPIADSKPHLVKGIVTIEPNGPPFHNVGSTPDKFAARPAGISYLPLTFSPRVERISDFGELNFEAPKSPDLEGCWIPKDPQPQLVNLKQIPVMLVVGQASYHAAYDHCTANFLQRSGVNVDFVRLEDHGILGNGHSMSVEKNNGEIADLIEDWLARVFG